MKLEDATILIADDEPVLCEIFAHWIKALGCVNVYTAADGEGALLVLQAHHVDLLVTDIRMPRMDGVTLVRRLGEMKRSMPSIIFVSGFGDIDLREMYALGVEAFLVKPSRREELLAVMENALAERSSLWLGQMDPPPRQSMVIDCGNLGESGFHLGRGGFSASYSGRLSLGKVSFQCSFPSEQREITGEGYVRWSSKAEQRCGVEFSYLDPPSRAWVLDEIAANAPRGFIPNI